MKSYPALVSFFIITVLAWLLSGTQYNALHFANAEHFFIENAVIDNPHYHSEPCNKAEATRLVFETSPVYSIVFKNSELQVDFTQYSGSDSILFQKSTRKLNLVFRVLRI